MDQRHILDNLSTHLKNTIARAISIAASMTHPDVGLLHLLLGLMEEKGSVGSEILAKSGMDKQYLLHELSKKPRAVLPHARNAGTTATMPELDGSAKQALERAMLLAYERAHNYIGTEHLLFGIIHSKDADATGLFEHARAQKKSLEEQLQNVLESTSHFPDLDEVSETLAELQAIAAQPAPIRLDAPPKSSARKRKGPVARRERTAKDVFTVELTDKKRGGAIDPVIGREKEIERLVNILLRRTKNNPVLIGEPGVGKTAIVEGLAKKITEGDVPDLLKRKKIFALDLTLLISGTIYRGEFEARLKQLIDEIAADPNAILFIDELHTIIGAGSNAGAMDAANILKPALARGELHCIGATTLDEYKKYISSDPALERRFQAIAVDEPSVEETVSILQGIKPYYEDFHRTTITDGAVRAAAELSAKYIHDAYLPDKAVDLIDEASSAARVKQKNSAEAEKVFALEDALRKCREKKEEAIHGERFDHAIHWKEKEAELLQKIQKAKAAREKTLGRQSKKGVTQKDVANVLGLKLNIAPELLLADDWERLATLPERIAERIAGQERVIGEVAQALRQAQLVARGGTRPLASFFFVGPSGVGKTELAKALARELYFDDKALIRLDMSEFSEAHGVSKLLGSPAGYVGYRERNRFADDIRSRPYSVVLFDEFDKAHADVRKLLYQILDEGELTDSTGKKISFRHAIIILTSNLGSELYKSRGIGFGGAHSAIGASSQKELENAMLAKIKEEFGAALIGRMHTVCVFEPLSDEHMELIVRRSLDKLSAQLAESRKLSVSADEKAIASLAKESYDEDAGARNMEHIVERVLHELILSELQKKTEKREYVLTKTKETYTLI